MKFNKTMVDVINEIRHSELSEKDKLPLKLNAPDIGDVLVKIYHQTNDIHTKALITIFMREAGESWIDNLEDEHKTSILHSAENFVSKIPSMFSVIKKANKTIFHH